MKIILSRPWCSVLWRFGWYRHGSPLRLMSHGRKIQTSAGRQPVKRWNRTISATTSGRQGRVASTVGKTSSVSRAAAEPGNSRQHLIDFRLHQLLTNRPAEHADDPTDIAVNRGPGHAGFDHLIPDCLEGTRCEVRGLRIGIQQCDEPQCRTDAALLGRRAAVFHVIPADMKPIGREQLDDRQTADGTIARLASAGEPFRNDPVILAFTRASTRLRNTRCSTLLTPGAPSNSLRDTACSAPGDRRFLFLPRCTKLVDVTICRDRDGRRRLHFPIHARSSHAIIPSTTARNVVAMNRLRRLNRQGHRIRQYPSI
jgi:hypothetical protein